MTLEPPKDDPASVYVGTDVSSAISEPDASSALKSFRPGDESICVWVEASAPRRVWVSFGLQTDDPEVAMREGLEQAAEIRDFLQRDAMTAEVTVYTESTQQRWTPDE